MPNPDSQCNKATVPKAWKNHSSRVQIRRGFFWVKVDLQSGSGFVRLEPNLADKKRLLQARSRFPGLEMDVGNVILGRK